MSKHEDILADALAEALKADSGVASSIAALLRERRRELTGLPVSQGVVCGKYMNEPHIMAT